MIFRLASQVEGLVFASTQKGALDQLYCGPGRGLETGSIDQVTEFACHRVNIDAAFSEAIEAARIDLLLVFCALVGFCRKGIEDKRLYDGLFIITLRLRVFKEVSAAPDNGAGVKAAVESDQVMSKLMSERVLLRRDAEEFAEFMIGFVDMDAGVAPLIVVRCYSTRRRVKGEREAGPSVRYRSHGHRLAR